MSEGEPPHPVPSVAKRAWLSRGVQEGWEGPEGAGDTA
eukprot:CAMPEP_0180314150 /NCGR_PEP_ID=MMETSP0988-20121125/31859_1 /TAXON_ID=697907 /ORGANISM="non described non described, Strain CCMP2293" /LENGTH=37 /DNA_ID= /DNA_START= /DNA_END= /DNA_ORIENTATION=